MSRRYREYDRVVVGAGVFGLFAARLFASRGMRVAVVDLDGGAMLRASLVNQARIHNGYHYPRSAYTALRSASYYDRFLTDFPDAVNDRFRKVYAISATGSYTDAEQFERFCARVGIPARRIDVDGLFREGTVEAAYETAELSFDAPSLRRSLQRDIAAAPGKCDWYLGDSVATAERDADTWCVHLTSGSDLRTPGVVNATYAGSNGVLATFGLEPLPLKYELCEVILVEAPAQGGVGLTVMDGPFFSLMPFGHSGLHSLTAVDYTPRASSSADLPSFGCQDANPLCRPQALDNCGVCAVRPATAFPQMLALTERYLHDVRAVRAVESIYSMKAVLQTSEVDDARPTLVRIDEESPLFVSLFSGKINTVYDLEDVL